MKKKFIPCPLKKPSASQIISPGDTNRALIANLPVDFGEIIVDGEDMLNSMIRTSTRPVARLEAQKHVRTSSNCCSAEHDGP